MTSRPQMAEAAGEAWRERANRPSSGLSTAVSNGQSRHTLGFRISGDVAAVAILVGVLAFLWGRGAGAWLWLDEGIAVGISSHALPDIPELLRQDGSPPLYYALLHLWMSMFGSSEPATHGLSLIFALATVPAALWAGWSLFGRRAGWMCALVASLSPFLASYGNETRMYSLVVLLALVAVATFVHAFVFRRRRYLIGFAGALTLLLYTHNWGLLLGVGCGAALVACLLVATDRRRMALDAGLAFGAVALMYLPWLPTLLYQHSAELQPWAQKPTLLLIRDQVATVAGGLEGAVALGLGAGVGLAAMLRWPWNRDALALVAIAITPIVVLAGGWLTSVFAYRYLAVVVAPIILLAGAGLARGGRTALAALGVVAFLTAPIGVKTPPYQKSNAKAVAEQASSVLEPGDVVISPDPQLPPLLSYYLPAGLRYVTTAGPVPDPGVVDWRGSLERLSRSDPSVTLPPVLDQLPPGSHALLVCPPTGARDLSTLRQRTGLDDNVPPPAAALAAGSVDRAADGADLGEAPAGLVPYDESSAALSPPPEGVSVFHSLISLRCEETTLLVLNHPQLRLERRLEAPVGITWTALDSFLLTKLA